MTAIASNVITDISLYGTLLFLCFYLSRTLNSYFFKRAVLETFTVSMKAGFGTDISLKLVAQYHGIEGVEIVQKEMQKECSHSMLALDRRMHHDMQEPLNFDPNKLKAIMKDNPGVKMGPSKQTPAYCVKCGKLFTDLNDWE